MVAEYSTILNPTPQVAYLTNDLGSPRINIDENGKVIARHDYRSYGEDRKQSGVVSDITEYESERRAYEAGSNMAQSLGMGAYNSNFPEVLTWNKGWLKQDLEVKRSNAITKFLRDREGVTKDDQGRRLSELYK